MTSATHQEIKSDVAYPVKIWATIRSDGTVDYSCAAETFTSQSSSSEYGANPTGGGESIEEAFENLSQLMKQRADKFNK